MSDTAKAIAALAVAVASAAVLATVRTGWVVAADAVVLVISLAALTRTAIRLASDPPAPRRP